MSGTFVYFLLLPLGICIFHFCFFFSFTNNFSIFWLFKCFSKNKQIMEVSLGLYKRISGFQKYSSFQGERNSIGCFRKTTHTLLWESPAHLKGWTLVFFKIVYSYNSTQNFVSTFFTFCERRDFSLVLKSNMKVAENMEL